jgi:hypothetical protein
MNRRRDEGLALILVMTVVLALAIIATPFVLSMILQERSGTTARYLSQAEYGADGAKNYAMWRLMMSLDPIERRNGTGLHSSYYYDTAQEFDIRLDDDLKTKLKIADPKGVIWGVTAQDEQGKLNTRTCNPNALRNLASMVDGRVINLKDYLTLYSGRDATWICPQKIRPVGFQNGSGSGGVTVDNLHVLGPQSRVRVSKQGMKPMETRVSGNSLLGSGGPDGFSCDQSVTAYIDGVIEVEQRHPVNINTAKKETLTAMFEGLHLYNVPASLVDRGSASQLATRFAGRDIQRLEQFLLALASASLSGPQKVAVALNAVCPNAALLDRSGTVPVCFKSYDVFTLEAFASVNNPAGTEVAGRGYREVVSVSPPSTLRLYCESQYDFNQMTSQFVTALQNIQPNLAFANFKQGPLNPRSYPYGNRILTYPRPYNEPSDITLKPQQKGGANGNEAFVTVQPAEDHRGENPDGYEQDLQGWNTDPHSRFHYGTELDGKKMSGPETFPWNQFFALNHTSEDDELQPAQQRPDTGSGGFEVWLRFDGSPGGGSIFEIQEQPTTNRVSLRMEGSDLVLTAADATIPNTADPDGRIANGVAEIRWPAFQITADTWTHFGAYWKSNRHADLALLVDGFSDPQAKFMHYTQPGGQKLMTKLSGALTQTSTSLTIQDPGICPNGTEFTPLLIGDEVVAYDKSSGIAVRGARGTAAQPHGSQVNVSLYGYSSKIRTGSITVRLSPTFTVPLNYDRIPQTNATSRYNFGMNPQAAVAGDKPDITGLMTQIDNSQVQIGVVLPVGSNITDYPDQGYIKINNEIIYYTARANGTVAGSMPPATAKFTGCTRAQFGTAAAIHPTGSGVQMWSIGVTNFNGFPQPNTVIQIGDEWFGPLRLDPSGKNFWVGFVDGTTPFNFPRGTLATVPAYHSAGDMVLPTFMARDVNSWPSYGWASGAGDRITLADAANQKQVARIRQASNLLKTAPPGGWDPSVAGRSQLVALTQPASRPWIADDLHVRMLKFPSGELLSRAWLDTASPQVTLGPVQGQIDELKAFAATKGRVRLFQPAAVGDTTLLVNKTGIPHKQDGGLIKLGDEYIGYGSWTEDIMKGTVAQVKRGWLNSTAELQDQGGNAFYLPWIPVSALAGDVSADDKVIRLRQHLAGDTALYKKGYVLLDNEMILFEWNGAGNPPDGLTLAMPARWDGQKGLYRGMFGTGEASHSSGTSLVYGMPFRTWDTYKQREFDNSMVYFQWSTKLDLAHWNTFRWTQEIPSQDKNIVIHALARVDGKGEFWDAPGMNDNVMLIDSVTPGTNVKVNRTGYLQDAGQFDVRFYVEYKQGAFDAQNMRMAESWKRYPKIKEIQVEYDRPCQTLHHEDR